MKIFRIALISILCLTSSVAAFAVTDKEMEEAKAITAKAYLRYANNGSDYLDALTVKSIADLTPKLKEKEKENIKAFNSVKIPSDYAGWDKEKLVEFWSVTFFTSPALTDQGKIARTRVKNLISAMNVSAPQPAETPKPEAAPAQDAEVVPEQATAEVPTAETAIEQQEEILGDQQAIAEDAAAVGVAEPVNNEQSHTWVYVLVLSILVAIVIWLVVYAANLMKRQPDDDPAPHSRKGGDNEGELRELREQARTAIAKKNEEVVGLQQNLERAEARNAELSEEVSRLRKEIEMLKSAATRQQPARAPRREAQPAEEPILKVLYLGRVNARGLFVRADRRINPGNTIFRLDTKDGLVGTFHVVDEPEVVDVALSAPTEYLGHGCTGEDLEDTTGVSRIITESAGTAIFENNCWKVLRKTRIRYE